MKEDRLGEEPDVHKQQAVGPVAEVQEVVVPALAPVGDEARCEERSRGYRVHAVEGARRVTKPIGAQPGAENTMSG